MSSQTSPVLISALKETASGRLRLVTGTICLAAILVLFAAAPVYALDVKSGAAGLGQALDIKQRSALIVDGGDGFSLGSSFFSGRSSGTMAQRGYRLSGGGVLGQNEDRFAELEGDQRVVALLIDGKYDFSYDFGAGLDLHPYIGGGLGLAVYEARSYLNQNASMAPMVRVGGGVIYKMGSDWDISLNYKAGYAVGLGGGVFTGRSQEKIDLQSLDMGLKYKF